MPFCTAYSSSAAVLRSSSFRWLSGLRSRLYRNQGSGQAITMPWMYILECSDGSYYVGSARDLETRIAQHQAGGGSVYTSRRLPVKLVFAAEFPNIAEAYAFEKQVQGWRRAKREAPIRGDFDKLPELAKKDWERYRNQL